jgi:uncharacterized protein YdeI (YjbR/CyaY-like superfamily)
MKKSTRVDDYIAAAPEYARPILEKIRKLYHKACPQIEETIKWGVPHFEYQGVVGAMAAFKHHVGFGFWKGALLEDPLNLFQGVGNSSMCAVKVGSLADLPGDKVLIDYIKEAVALNEQGIKVPKKAPRKEVDVPDYFLAAIKKNAKALATFEAFSPSCKREYVEWVTEAKQETTRQKRLATTVEWLAEGKSRNWKYR